MILSCEKSRRHEMATNKFTEMTLSNILKTIGPPHLVNIFSLEYEK